MFDVLEASQEKDLLILDAQLPVMCDDLVVPDGRELGAPGKL